MPAEPSQPARAALTATSSREEVLAAVAEHERVCAAAQKAYEDAEFPEVPEGYTGCVWSKDGKVRVHYGPIDEHPVAAAQRLAGEEDQTPADWQSM